MGVMNVKRSATNNSRTDHAVKSDGPTSGDAADFKKAYGGQDMGQVLNKVADPNWIDPTKKARGVGNAELGKDAFMKMMLAQMKNQDPTNPTPSHEMAAQLAQFSSLEQLSNINTSIEGLKQATAPAGNYQALAFIGKKVSGDGAAVTRAKGDTKHDFNFDLMGDVQKAKITVKDAAGNVVRTYQMANLKKGANSMEWNGLQEDGTPARTGDYKFVIEATSSTGQKVYAKTNFEGRITGMNFGADGPILMVGKKQVRMSEVKKIEEAPAEDVGATAIPLKAGALNAQPGEAQMAMARAAQGMAAATAAPTNVLPQMQAQPQAAAPKVDASRSPVQAAKMADADIPPAEDVDPASIGNIADIPMAQGMLNKLAKEMK
jgi:flagellar basal-body rod modification protein FlgD